ncbi:hypothetical protein [Shimia sp.]|uniref:hypothetical protein n=1 Tax=Shimia sp. TaxID=1954381 RepID=UPI003298AF69
MKLKLHAIAGTVALLTICTFWTTTIISEVIGDHALITQVKTGVLYGMFLLIPAMATAGATGAMLGKGWRLPQVKRKQGRMKIIAANGIIILLPCAIFLATRAQYEQFDNLFYMVQAAELIAGATNITLLSLNMKDGMALRTRRKKRAEA